MFMTCTTEWIMYNANIASNSLTPGYVISLILDVGEHGEHADHIRPHPISKIQHGIGKKLPQQTCIKLLR